MSLHEFLPHDLAIPSHLIDRQAELYTHSPPIVVSAVSAITPFGMDVGSFWRGVKMGKSAIGPLGEEFDPLQGARLPFRDPIHKVLADKLLKIYPRKEIVSYLKDTRTPELAALVLMATYDLLASAGFLDKQGRLLPDIKHESIGGVVVGTGFGNFKEARHGVMNATAPLTIDDTRLAAIPNLFFGLPHGPISTVTAACASSGEAYHQAYRAIQTGEADFMLVVGADLSIQSEFMEAFYKLGAISPTNRCLPMAADRNGFVMGEGAGAILLETEEHALRRGQKRHLANAVGSGHASDNYHETAPHPEGLGIESAITQALIGVYTLLPPEEVRKFIIAFYGHLTGTPPGDDRELRGMRHALSTLIDNVASVSSIKDKTGHAMGAAAILNMIAAIYSLYDGFVVPAPYLRDMAAMPEVRALNKPEKIRDNRETVPVFINPAHIGPTMSLSTSAGFGGLATGAAFTKAAGRGMVEVFKGR